MDIIAMSERGDVESREVFVARNVDWWRKQQRSRVEAERWPVFEQFLCDCKFSRGAAVGWSLGEIGGGPYGGILRGCGVVARRYYFIDYIQRELCALGFIDWPPENVYVTAPAEDLPLRDGELDCLLSYNTLDHGWDIEAALRECVRVARRSYVCFDCRSEDEEDAALRRGIDKDHWQLLRFAQVEEVLSRLGTPYILRDASKNHNRRKALVLMGEACSDRT